MGLGPRDTNQAEDKHTVQTCSLLYVYNQLHVWSYAYVLIYENAYELTCIFTVVNTYIQGASGIAARFVTQI